MMFIVENQISAKKTCLSTTLSTTNATYINLGLKTNPQGKTLANSHPSHSMACNLGLHRYTLCFFGGKNRADILQCLHLQGQAVLKGFYKQRAVMIIVVLFRVERNPLYLADNSVHRSRCTLSSSV
jgi:hypothetical protein